MIMIIIIIIVSSLTEPQAQLGRKLAAYGRRLFDVQLLPHYLQYLQLSFCENVKETLKSLNV